MHNLVNCQYGLSTKRSGWSCDAAKVSIEAGQMLSHQRRPDALECSCTVCGIALGLGILRIYITVLMLRAVITRHSMSYANSHPTHCTWLKPLPTAKQMLCKPALRLAVQSKQHHGPERLNRQFTRCMASSRGSDDKSWSELASMPQACFLTCSLPARVAC